MRTTPTLLLFALPLLSEAQVPGDTLVMDFDEGATLVLDSVYPAGCWQVGAPAKPVFTTALSLPRALVTDTILPYPENSTCYAEFTLLADELDWNWGRWFEFDQWLDLAPGTRAWIEARDTWSMDWTRLVDGWYLSGNVVYLLEGPEFAGSTNGWEHVIFDSPCIGVMNGPDDRWYDPLMRLRFVFTSTSNVGGHDGWMIDNFRATATPCSGGISEEGINRLKVDPVPANDVVRLSFGSTIEGDAIIDLITTDGRVVLAQRIQGASLATLDVSAIENGCYVCRVSNKDMSSSARLLVAH
ncbi:MAG: T9SS type A sorting domain-containing protein [Flavobacteriales bacterium]|nr:T9SS type A sorting domain-containing protein [Flavobacteriales bacterium]